MISVYAHWLICWMALIIGGEDSKARESVYHIDFTTSFQILGPTQLIKYTIILPQNIDGAQEITQLSFSPEPRRIYEKNGNRYAEFRVPRPKRYVEVRLKMEVKTSPVIFEKNTFLSSSESNEADWQNYLSPSEYQESDHPEIRSLSTRSTSKLERKVLRDIYRFVQDTLTYKLKLNEDLGALSALQQGIGDCSEYSDLFVALCRANGIPARTVSGWLLQDYISNPNHHWVEVWVDDAWRAIDPSTPDESTLFIQSPHVSYLRLSPHRVDKVCKTSNDRWVATGKVKSTYSYYVKKK